MRARCQLQGLRLSPWAEGVSQGSTWGIPRLPGALTPGYSLGGRSTWWGTTRQSSTHGVQAPAVRGTWTGGHRGG